MDMNQVNNAFKLCYKGTDLEQTASRIKHGLATDGNWQQLKKLAAEHYTQAIEILLTQKGQGKAAAIIQDMVVFLMDRLETVLQSYSTPRNKEQPLQGVVMRDPVRDTKRKKVAEELLATEQSFGKSMKLMIDRYVVPLEEQEVLSEEEAMVVFASCVQISGLSDQMCGTLKQKLWQWDPDSTTLGDVFLLYADFFKMYIPFANNFARGQAILATKSFDAITANATSFGAPPLDSLRIMPIQRIPRYVLLITELLKATLDGHPDKLLLEKALEKMKIVAQHVDARLTASEMEAKVLEVQSSLWTATGTIPELVAPGRIFIKEGPVAKIRSTGGIRRNYYLFCFNDIVVYATTNPLFRNKYHFHKALDYYGAFPADEEVKQLGLSLKYGESAFKITGSNGYRIFVADSDAERKDWLRALTDSATVKEKKRISWGKARGELLDDEDDEYDDDDDDD